MGDLVLRGIMKPFLLIRNEVTAPYHKANQMEYIALNF